MRYFLSIFSFLTITTCLAQSDSLIRTLDSAICVSKIDSIKLQFSSNKTIPSDHELVAYIALSYYPELSDTKIEFKQTKIKTTLNARPTVGSLLFRSKSKRKYVIRINTKMKDSVINFATIPFNAKVGLLGHEYAHLQDYNERNFFQVIARMFAYSTKKSKAKFEKEIDMRTILKSLGWQLYDWSYYVLEESNASFKYKEFKKETYLTPSQIQEEIERIEDLKQE